MNNQSSGFQTLVQQSIKDKRNKQKHAAEGSKSPKSQSVRTFINSQSNSNPHQQQMIGSKKNVHFEELAQRKVLQTMASTVTAAQGTPKISRFMKPAKQSSHDNNYAQQQLQQRYHNQGSFPITVQNDDLMVSGHNNSNNNGGAAMQFESLQQEEGQNQQQQYTDIKRYRHGEEVPQYDADDNNLHYSSSDTRKVGPLETDIIEEDPDMKAFALKFRQEDATNNILDNSIGQELIPGEHLVREINAQINYNDQSVVSQNMKVKNNLNNSNFHDQRRSATVRQQMQAKTKSGLILQDSQNVYPVMGYSPNWNQDEQISTKALIRPSDDVNRSLIADTKNEAELHSSNAYEVALIGGEDYPPIEGHHRQQTSFVMEEDKLQEEIDAALSQRSNSKNNKNLLLSNSLAAERPHTTPLLMIKIDLGGGKFASINALKDSNSIELATQFCQEYQLPATIIEPLSNRIMTNIQSHFNSENIQQQPQPENNQIYHQNESYSKISQSEKRQGSGKSSLIFSKRQNSRLNRNKKSQSKIVQSRHSKSTRTTRSSPKNVGKQRPASSFQSQTITSYNLKSTPHQRNVDLKNHFLSRAKSMTAGPQVAVQFTSPKQEQQLLQAIGSSSIKSVGEEGDEVQESQSDKNVNRSAQQTYLRPPESGLIDFQMSKSFHNRFISPSQAKKKQRQHSFNPRKIPPLPSDHPEVQGVQEVPAINSKSQKMVEKRQNEDPIHGSIHERLHSRTLIKDELARRVKFEQEEEKVRKNEFMLRNFSEHRHSVSQGLTQGNRMYAKGIKMIENRERKATQAKMQREHTDVEDCTFKPKMQTKRSSWSKMERNRRSQSQIDGPQNSQAPRFEELYEKGKEKIHKMEIKRRQQEKEQQQAFNYKPVICQKSKDMVEARLAQYTMQSAAQIKIANDSMPGSNFLGRDLSPSGGLRSIVSFGDDINKQSRAAEGLVRASQTQSSLKVNGPKIDMRKHNELLIEEQEGDDSNELDQNLPKGVGAEGIVMHKIIVPSQYDLLYQDAMSRVLRHQRIQKAFIEKDCTFAPQINRRANDLSLTSTASLNGAQKTAASKAAAKRLYRQATLQQKRQNEVDYRRKRGDFDTDCTFEPQTNSRLRRGFSADANSSYFSKRSRSRNDAGYTRSMVLYDNYYRLEDRKKKLREDEVIRQNYKRRDATRKNQKSEAIIEHKKEQMLAFIFDCLDGDRDNWISINAINIEAVSRDISQILMPIIQELEDLEEGVGAIDKNEFIQACLRLYQTLNVTQRNILLNFNKPKKQAYEEEFQYKPEISQKSQMLATQQYQGQSSFTAKFEGDTMTFGANQQKAQRGTSQPMSFHERQQYHQQKKEDKIKQQQYINEMAQMEGCTFAPTIHNSNIANATQPDFSYVKAEERHHQLQNYLEGQSYGGQSENDSIIRNAAQEVNYVNNL